MALFSSTTLESLDDLLVEQIQDLYDAEKRLSKALPEMSDAAENLELKNAFQSHLRETEGHVKRLETVFQILGKNPHAKTCEAMKGLVKEGNEVMNMEAPSEVRDAALIAAAQRVEHYEMAGYGTARTFASRLGYLEAARILQETLDEEGEADKKLTHIAEQTINRQAAATA